MSFTPTEELERFGKRRKLIEAGHNRLVSSGDSISQPRLREEARERAPSELGTMGNMDIQIYRPPVDPASSSISHKKASNESSQPMLLDREDSNLVDRSLSPDGGTYSPRRGRTISSQLLLSSQNLPRQSPSLAPSDTIFPIESVSQEKYQQHIHQFSPYPYLQPSMSPMRLHSSTPSLHQPIPQLPRRFTIDDQIAAELEDIYAHLRHSDTAGSYATSKCSSEKMRNGHSFGCTASGTRSTSSNRFSSWLPEPKHHVQRFMGQNYHQTNTSSAVTMSETVDREQPVYNNNPHFNPPQSYITLSLQHTQIQEDTNQRRHILNGFSGIAVSQPFSDRLRRGFEIYQDTSFTPSRQRISRQLARNNMRLLNDIAEKPFKFYGRLGYELP